MEEGFFTSYYSAAEEGWFCKTCQEYSHNGYENWKTFPRKYDTHLGVFFREHENSKKHKDAVANKKEVKAILSKGNVLKQLQLAMEAGTNAEWKLNRNIVKKLIKTVYFLSRKKWAVKQNFEELKKLINFIAFELEDLDLSAHILSAPKNAPYCTTNSVEEFLKLIGEFLHDQNVTDLQLSGDFTLLADESTDEADRSQAFVFARYVDVSSTLLVEKFLGIVKLSTSKRAIDLHVLIMKLLN